MRVKASNVCNERLSTIEMFMMHHIDKGLLLYLLVPMKTYLKNNTECHNDVTKARLGVKKKFP